MMFVNFAPPPQNKPDQQHNEIKLVEEAFQIVLEREMDKIKQDQNADSSSSSSSADRAIDRYVQLKLQEDKVLPVGRCHSKESIVRLLTDVVKKLKVDVYKGGLQQKQREPAGGLAEFSDEEDQQQEDNSLLDREKFFVLAPTAQSAAHESFFFNTTNENVVWSGYNSSLLEGVQNLRLSESLINRLWNEESTARTFTERFMGAVRPYKELWLSKLYDEDFKVKAVEEGLLQAAGSDLTAIPSQHERQFEYFVFYMLIWGCVPVKDKTVVFPDQCLAVYYEEKIRVFSLKTEKELEELELVYPKDCSGRSYLTVVTSPKGEPTLQWVGPMMNLFDFELRHNELKQKKYWALMKNLTPYMIVDEKLPPKQKAEERFSGSSSDDGSGGDGGSKKKKKKRRHRRYANDSENGCDSSSSSGSSSSSSETSDLETFRRSMPADDLREASGSSDTSDTGGEERDDGKKEDPILVDGKEVRLPRDLEREAAQAPFTLPRASTSKNTLKNRVGEMYDWESYRERANLRRKRRLKRKIGDLLRKESKADTSDPLIADRFGNYKGWGDSVAGESSTYGYKVTAHGTGVQQVAKKKYKELELKYNKTKELLRNIELRNRMSDRRLKFQYQRKLKRLEQRLRATGRRMVYDEFVNRTPDQYTPQELNELSFKFLKLENKHMFENAERAAAEVATRRDHLHTLLEDIRGIWGAPELPSRSYTALTNKIETLKNTITDEYGNQFDKVIQTFYDSMQDRVQNPIMENLNKLRHLLNTTIFKLTQMADKSNNDQRNNFSSYQRIEESLNENVRRLEEEENERLEMEGLQAPPVAAAADDDDEVLEEEIVTCTSGSEEEEEEEQEEPATVDEMFRREDELLGGGIPDQCREINELEEATKRHKKKKQQRCKKGKKTKKTTTTTKRALDHRINAEFAKAKAMENSKSRYLFKVSQQKLKDAIKENRHKSQVKGLKMELDHFKRNNDILNRTLSEVNAKLDEYIEKHVNQAKTDLVWEQKIKWLKDGLAKCSELCAVRNSASDAYLAQVEKLAEQMRKRFKDLEARLLREADRAESSYQRTWLEGYFPRRDDALGMLLYKEATKNLRKHAAEQGRLIREYRLVLDRDESASSHWNDDNEPIDPQEEQQLRRVEERIVALETSIGDPDAAAAAPTTVTTEMGTQADIVSEEELRMREIEKELHSWRRDQSDFEVHAEQERDRRKEKLIEELTDRIEEQRDEATAKAYEAVGKKLEGRATRLESLLANAYGKIRDLTAQNKLSVEAAEKMRRDFLDRMKSVIVKRREDNARIAANEARKKREAAKEREERESWNRKMCEKVTKPSASKSYMEKFTHTAIDVNEDGEAIETQYLKIQPQVIRCPTGTVFRQGVFNGSVASWVMIDSESQLQRSYRKFVETHITRSAQFAFDRYLSPFAESVLENSLDLRDARVNTAWQSKAFLLVSGVLLVEYGTNISIQEFEKIVKKLWPDKAAKRAEEIELIEKARQLHKSKPNNAGGEPDEQEL